MKRRLLFIVTTLLAAAPGSVSVSAQRATGEVQFLELSLPGKVEFVTWGLDKDWCSVQVFGPAYRAAYDEPTSNIQAHESQLPRVQVWLLKADGTSIPQTRRPEKGSVVRNGVGRSVIAAYFPSSARTEAISVVISIDDEFMVERIQRP
jgi:hypothetical protein